MVFYCILRRYQPHSLAFCRLQCRLTENPPSCRESVREDAPSRAAFRPKF